MMLWAQNPSSQSLVVCGEFLYRAVSRIPSQGFHSVQYQNSRVLLLSYLKQTIMIGTDIPLYDIAEIATVSTN